MITSEITILDLLHFKFYCKNFCISTHRTELIFINCTYIACSQEVFNITILRSKNCHLDVMRCSLKCCIKYYYSLLIFIIVIHTTKRNLSLYTTRTIEVMMLHGHCLHAEVCVRTAGMFGKLKSY